MRRIYLDNNATTGLDPLVLEAMLPALSETPLNPSSVHFFGQRAKDLLTQARESIARSLKVRAHEIIFTSGGTEAINMLIKGISSTSTPGHCITTEIEHASVYLAMKNLEQSGWKVTYLPVDRSGAIEPSQLENAIQATTRFIVLSAANSETGVKAPLQEISSISERHGIPLLIDGVALIGKETFLIPSGVSAIAFSAHKFHGPKGIGFAVVRPHIKLSPLLVGGHQEYAKRAGTENLAGILGCAKAVALLDHYLPEATERMRQLRDYFESELQRRAGVVVNGSKERVANTCNVTFPLIDGETLLLSLDMHGIAASHGSACSAGALEPSRVLLSMGLTYPEARNSIRFSLSRWTTKDDIEYTLDVIDQLHANKCHYINRN